MKDRILSLLKLVIGVGLLIYLYILLPNPQALWQQITTANPWLLLLGVLCYTSAVALGGVKWGILLHSVRVEVPMTRLLSHQWQAEFFNNFLPGQVGGDVVRGYGLAADTRRRAAAAASVLIDRFIGLTVFMLAASVAAISMLVWGKRADGTAFTADQLVAIRLIALGVVAITLLLLSITAIMLSRRLKNLAERMLARLPLADRTVPVWHALAEAFNAYRYQYRAMLLTALCSTLIVIVTSVNIWLISEAIEPHSISLLAVLAINPIIVFLALVPISPGGLGLRQSIFAGLFLLIGAGFQLGFAVGLIQQFIGYLVSVPGGYLWIRGRSRTPQPTSSTLPSERPTNVEHPAA
jgi:hypothetical protein